MSSPKRDMPRTHEVADLDHARERLRERASPPSPSRLLEADDVADILGMTTDWIYREVRAGRLPHIRLGRYVRFRQESIDAWLDTCEHGGRVPQGGRGR